MVMYGSQADFEFCIVRRNTQWHAVSKTGEPWRYMALKPTSSSVY